MNREELVKTLELIKPALSKENIIPVYQCYCFKGGTVSAYNDQIGIIGPTECESAFATHGTTLLGLLSASTAEKMEISFDKNSVKFKVGKAELDLPFFPQSDFLFTPKWGEWNAIPVTISLIEAMKICLETVSADETQRALQGISIIGDRMYSCNGDTLTRIGLKNAPKTPIMLPTAFCESMIKLWTTLNVTKGGLSYSKEWLVAKYDDWEIWGRVPEIDKLPDFEGWIKKGLKADRKLMPLPKGFSEALARARVLAEPESQKTQIAIEHGNLYMTTSTHMGDANDVLSLKGHPDVVCNVNCMHLQQAITHCDTIAFHGNCTVFEKAPHVFMIMGNM